MKKSLLLTLLLVLGIGFFSRFYAQVNISIGNGADTNTATGYPTPYGTYYKNFRQQYLVLASEIIDSGGGQGAINSLALNVAAVNNCSPMPNYTIRLKHSTQTALSTDFEEGPYQTVFVANSYMPVAAWNTHDLSEPFVWDGSSNILIDIVSSMIPGAYSQNASVFYTGTGFNSSLRFQSDTLDASTYATGTPSNKRANIRFNMPALVVTVPPNPAIIVSPANGAVNIIPSSTLNWNSGGAAPSGYKVHFGTTNPPPFVQNTTETTYAPTMQGSSTYYWKIVPFNAVGDALDCPLWSFSTSDLGVTIGAGNQAARMPMDFWFKNSLYETLYMSSELGFDSGTITSLAFYNSFTSNIPSAVTRIWLGSTSLMNLSAGYVPSTQLTLVFDGTVNYPSGANTIPIQFQTSYMHTSGNLVMMVQRPMSTQDYSSSDNFICQTVGTNRARKQSHDTTVFDPASPPMGNLTGQFPKTTFFYSIQTIVNDLACLGLTGNLNPSANSATNYSVTVKNNGTATQNVYTVKLYKEGGVQVGSVSGTALASMQTASFSIPWTPTATGPTFIYAKVILATDELPLNNQSANLAVNVMPGGLTIVTIGDGSLAEGVPFEFHYRSSLFETIYYPTEVGMFGNIVALTFYNNFVTNLPDKPVKIWLGSTTLTDLSEGWIPSYSLTQVFNGNVSFPSGQNSVTITLQTPFSYYGGNLVLYANRPLDTVYFSSSDNFLAQSIGNNRALKISSDSVDYDPMFPPATGTLSGTFPKTSLHISPFSPDAWFFVSPTSHNFSNVLMDSTNDKPFYVMNAGVGNLSVSTITVSGSPFFTIQNPGALPAILTTGQTLPFTVSYLPTTAGNHTATINITSNRMVHTVTVSGTSIDPLITSLPYTQAFDELSAPALPITWNKLVQSSAGASVQTYNPGHSAPNSAGLNNSTDTNATVMLIAPPLAASISVNTTRIKFWAKSAVAGYPISIGVMNDPQDAATYTELQIISLSATFAQYSVDLTTYTGSGTYLAFKHGLGGANRLLYVDDVMLELTSPSDLAAISITGNLTPSVGVASDYIVSVFNNGTAAQSVYSVKLYDAAHTELATAFGTTIAAGATVQISLLWTPSTEGPASIYGKVILAEDLNPANDQTAPISVTIQPAGFMSVTIGAGNLSEGIPFEFFYKCSIFETLYYPAEIGMFGNIVSLTFYNNFITNLPDKPVKLWLGTTLLPDLSAGWIPGAQMTQVFNGTVSFPSGQNSVVIPLQVPFNYSGGNLVLLANRPLDTAYFSPLNDFKAQTIGTSRSLKLTSDITDDDPLNPPFAGSLSGTFPKTTITMTPVNPNPTFAVSPPSNNFGQVMMGMTASTPIQALNVGGGTLIINSVTISGSPFFSLEDVPTLPASLTNGQFMSFISRYSPNAAGDHTATITITDHLGDTRKLTLGSPDAQSRTAHEVELSGTCFDPTITALPYTENFDTVIAPALPPTWNKLVQSTDASFLQSNSNLNHSAPNSVGMSNMDDIAATLLLIAPPLATSIPVNTIRIKFWARSGSAGYPLSIGVMTNPQDAATYTQIQSVTLSNLFVEYTLALTSYTGDGRYITFKHGLGGAFRSLYVDDFLVELLDLNDLGASAIAGDDSPLVGIPSDYTVTVQNWGNSIPSAYNVKLMSGTTELASVAGASVAPGDSVNVVLSWTPTAEGPMSIYGKVILNGDINPGNDASDPMPINVQPAEIAFAPGAVTAELNASQTEALINWLPPEPNALELTQSSTNTSGVYPNCCKFGTVPITTDTRASESTRSLEGYKIWRLAPNQEANPDSWTLLTPVDINTLTFTDTGWADLPNGDYRWAVKAVYSSNVISLASFSNVLFKGHVTGIISGVVQRSNNQAIPGATVTAGIFTATTNTNGAYVLMLPIGIYTVTASMNGYVSGTVENVVVNADQTTTVNFIIVGVGTDDEVVPATITALLGNYPNPFNPSTTISYSIKDPSPVKLVIYNMKGQKIKTLVDQNQTNGRYNAVWNGKDDNNKAVGSGVYYYRMTTAKYISTRKMLLVE